MSSLKVAFLSDIHGNSPALRAVLEDIRQAGCAQVFMLGDLINGIDPHGCVQLLRGWSESTGLELAALRGNAEAYLTTPERAGLPRQDEAWNAQLMRLVDWFQNQLSQSDLAWIHSLPGTLRWRDSWLVHDSPMDRLAAQAQGAPEVQPRHREWFFHGRGIQPDMEESRWQELLAHMEAAGASRLFCGHTHVPFQRRLDGRTICNVGSAGAPLDGDPRPAWVLLEEDHDGTSTLSIRRVAYDLPAILRLLDCTPEYPDFVIPGYREAYKKWMQTGVHWRAHLGSA